jgi:SAM-dependent methyltransferase
VKSLRERHIPAPDTHPSLCVVGDYLFDSTVNGTYDSADFVVDTIQTILRKQKYAYQLETKITTQAVNEKGEPVPLHLDYYELYDGQRPYEESFEEYFCEHYTTDLIREIWGWSPPYKLLDGGSANGLTLERFEAKGVKAWGIEFNPLIHARTAEKWKSRNILGSVCDLPFEDKSFDFIYDTCLCYVPPENLDNAIAEMFRVCRVGVFFGGITSDMTETVIEKHDLFEGVQTLCSLGDWMELFMKQGFRPAVTDIKVLKRIWKIENDANLGDDQWYPDMHAMRCCFYSKPDAPRRPKRGGKSRIIKLEHALAAKPRKQTHAGASAEVAVREGEDEVEPAAKIA